MADRGRLRVAAGNGFWGGLLDCFNCMSLWIAAPFALGIGATPEERFCLWLAFSGGAVVLQRLTAQVAPMPAFFEAEIPTMSCCGKVRARNRQVPRPHGRPAPVPDSSACVTSVGEPGCVFQLPGTDGHHGDWTVLGRTYRFAAGSGPMEIDPRDAASLSRVPNLRMVPKV